MGKIAYNSPVILTFALLSFIVLIMNSLTGGFSNYLIFSVYKSSFADVLAYIRIFLHVLGHVNFNHYFSNMLIILLVGPILEEKYGSQIILYLIIFTALITGLFNILFFKTALLGASGVAFMFILLASFVNLEKNKIPLTLIIITIMYIGNEIITGIITTDNISQITHIIGGFCGAFFGYILNAGGKK